MLELEEAIARILTSVPPAKQEKVPLAEAHGRILAQDTLSPIDLPPFDNSAMDGYAVRSGDVTAASSDKPVALKLAARVAAGEMFGGELLSGACVRLFTGSPLPKGCDCVVMQEDTQVDPDNPNRIHILDKCRPWENVRLKGEDVRAGAVLITAGQLLNAGHLSLLSATGVEHVLVGRPPRVGVIATGSELKEPGQTLAAGQIYESNRLGLATLIRCAGAKPVLFPIVPDKPEETERALAQAFSRCDLVVSAGGASVGEMDLIKPSFERLGGQLDFWKVAMKPGRPFTFGRLRGQLFFGLPGNPISALVTFLLLVRPALKRWQGARDTEMIRMYGVLGEDLTNPATRRHFARVRIQENGAVWLAGAQGSHVLSSFAAAQGLVDVPPQTTLRTGTRVIVRAWDC